MLGSDEEFSVSFMLDDNHNDSNLTLKRQTKSAADYILIFYFNLSKKIRLDFHVNPLPSRGFT